MPGSRSFWFHSSHSKWRGTNMALVHICDFAKKQGNKKQHTHTHRARPCVLKILLSAGVFVFVCLFVCFKACRSVCNWVWQLFGYKRGRLEILFHFASELQPRWATGWTCCRSVWLHCCKVGIILQHRFLITKASMIALKIVWNWKLTILQMAYSSV